MIMNPIAFDLQFRQTVIKKVDAVDDGWTVEDADGWSLFVTASGCSQPPDVGETMRQYGEGIGRPVRGIDIGGRVYRYETAADQQARQERERKERDAERLYDYQAKRPEFDARLSALPEPLQLRIIGFRKQGGDAWSSQFEAYEMFVCEQAAAIAAHFGNADAIEAWTKKTFAEQCAEFPELSKEHSGGTFGAAATLGRALVLTPNIVPQLHGAMCPLVGCREYGCFAARGQ